MFRTFLAVQLIVAVGAAASWILTPMTAAKTLAASTGRVGTVQPPSVTERLEPYRVEPFYNRPDLVSDEDLKMVLQKVRPVFPRRGTKSNYIEHALRIWSKDATFADEAAWSGAEMVDYLTDHAKYIVAWDQPVTLIEDRPEGLGIKWGRDLGSSVHHDHWLASLTEAGVSLDHPVYGPGRFDHTLRDVLNESLRDFELDEREVEWTAMAFGLWLPPTREWVGRDGRRFSFDLLVDRLTRGSFQWGVCAGTHRVYSLMLLVRLDDEFDVLSDEGRATAWSYLEQVRDRIVVSQYDDGRWATDWPIGESSKLNPADEPLHKQVIATGHHLEWLSIAPVELHPPAETIAKAMQWIIQTTRERTQEEVSGHYTFYSHVGAAVANWRSERVSDAWRRLEPAAAK